MSADAKTPAPYTGLKVIELAEDVGGEFTGRLLAEMGAEVIKVEPPQGSPTRAVGPFVGGKPDPDKSLNFWFYNSNKESVVLDVAAEGGLAKLHALVSGADVFISTLQPAALNKLGLNLNALTEKFPRLIVLSVTAFGLTGPWADYKSSDLIGLAAGGPLNSCGYDDHSIPPIRPGGNQAYHSAMSFAHIGVLLALLERQKTGKGQLVDVSMHEACAVNVELANPYWFYPKVHVHRQTCRHAQPSPTQPSLFKCADDRYVYFALILFDQNAWLTLVNWMDEQGLAAQLTQPEFLDFAYRQEHFHEIQEIIEVFFLVHNAEEIYHEGQARGLPMGPLNAPEDLFTEEHLVAREFFVPVQEAGIGTVKYPGAAYRFSSFDPVERKSAPKLGADTEAVLATAGAK